MVDWKKEIKLSDLVGGKKSDERPDDAQPASIWKKEISFRRKPKEPTPGDERAADAEETAEEPAPEPQAAVELVNAYVRPKPAPSPEPSVEAPRVPAPEPEPALDAAEAVVELIAPAAVPGSAAPELEVATAESPGPVVGSPPPAEVVDLLVAAAPPDPPPATPAPPSVDASLAPTEPAPEPEVTPALPAPAPAVERTVPVVVHPPVPSAALPPLPEDETPKRRNRKEKEKNEKPPKGAAGVPFYRRELSFGRKKQRTEPVAREAEETAPKELRERRRSPSFSLPRPQPRARGGKAPKRIVGLKVGASQVAAATVSNNGHSEVLQLARRPLDPGVVANGELRDPERLAEELRELFKSNKLPRGGVRLGIATSRIGVRTLEIVGIDDPKQLANAIRFRAQEALPIPIDEAVLDYQVLAETTNDDGESVRKILLVLAYRDLIDRYVGACRRAGLTLVGIDLEAFALLRALAAPRDEESRADAALVAVTIGHDRTTFAVSDGRICEFTRVLDWGGATLSVALARALDLTPSEAEPIKRELSLGGTEVPDGLTPEAAQRGRDALVVQVQSFARELVSSLQFYQNQPDSLGIGEIIITGGTAHLRGFAEELQRLIGVRVRVGDPLVRVKLGKKLEELEQIGSMSVAIGLGIED